jgi:hypothetical protein
MGKQANTFLPREVRCGDLIGERAVEGVEIGKPVLALRAKRRRLQTRYDAIYHLVTLVTALLNRVAADLDEVEADLDKAVQMSNFETELMRHDTLTS